MSLAEHYQAAYSLDPEVARRVLPQLDGIANLPSPWRLAIRTALQQRARYAGSPPIYVALFLCWNRLACALTLRRSDDDPVQRQAQDYLAALCQELSITSEEDAWLHFGGPPH